MNRGLEIGGVIVGAAAVGTGAYLLLRPASASSSNPLASLFGSGSGSASPGPSGSTVVRAGRANASGATVTLSAPTTGSVGQALTLTATASGLTNPVYQFWYLDPSHSGPSSQNGWTSWGAYQSPNGWQLVPGAPGSYQVVVYARNGTAPSAETSSQRQTYEARSTTYQITVS